MRSSVTPQPPIDPINSKSPRLRGVHFNNNTTNANTPIAASSNRIIAADATTIDDSVSAAELNEKVEAMLVILNKAKTDREELMEQISILKAEKRKKDEILTENAKKRMIEERAFRDTLMKERVVSDQRINKQREATEQRTGLIVDFAMFLTNLESNYPQIKSQEIMQKAFALVPSSLEACRVLRRQLGLPDIVSQTQLPRSQSPEKGTKKRQKKGSRKSPTRNVEIDEAGGRGDTENDTGDEGVEHRHRTLDPVEEDVSSERSRRRYDDNVDPQPAQQDPFGDLTNRFVASLDQHSAKQAAREPDSEVPEAKSSSYSGNFQDIQLSTPTYPSAVPTKSTGKYMRPNPKLKLTGQNRVAAGNGGRGYDLVTGDDDNDDDDYGSSPSRRARSPKEKLLIIKEMMTTGGSSR